MPTYISLIHFTHKGVEEIKQSPARLDQVKAAAKAAGGELKAFYLTLGRYDAVVIGEGPSDEAYARVLLATAGAGAVRTETMRAFTEEEYRKLLAPLA